MILYHFTSFYALKNAGDDAILKAGIRAHDASDDYPMFAHRLRPLVWLTSDPEMPKCFQRGSEARIHLKLSEYSSKLVSWPKWLRRVHFEDAIQGLLSGFEAMERLERSGSLSEDLGRQATKEELTAWRKWWVHFGDIPLTAILNIEYADPKRRAEAEATGEGRTVTFGQLDAERHEGQK